jgi:ferredoxin-type protein NapG
MDRRHFLHQAAQGTAAATCGGLAWFALLQQQAQAAQPLRPPGAVDGFAAACIRCGQCVQACPYDSVQLVATGGAAGGGLPQIVPRQTPCFMCEPVHCVKACPTGALAASLTDITQARMGLAVIDVEHCLSWQGLRCEVCFRVCPLQGQAIRIVSQQRQLSKHAMFVPLVQADHCTGCGLCEKRCPTEVPAIRVLDPALVQGRIGDHYRLGWRHGQTQPDAEAAAGADSAGAVGAAGAPPPRAQPQAPGDAAAKPAPQASPLDYFNR